MTPSPKASNPGTPDECDHTSVGVLVWRNGKLLLIERRRPPFGFAPPAGHVDNRNSFEHAARDELKEEVGLDAVQLELLQEGRKENKCRRKGGTWHYWKIYQATVVGQIAASPHETRSVRWCSPIDLRMLADATERYIKGEIDDARWTREPGLEPVWYEWLSALNLL